jgi:hypothetical protein
MRTWQVSDVMSTDVVTVDSAATLDSWYANGQVGPARPAVCAGTSRPG